MPIRQPNILFTCHYVLLCTSSRASFRLNKTGGKKKKNLVSQPVSLSVSPSVRRPHNTRRHRGEGDSCRENRILKGDITHHTPHHNRSLSATAALLDLREREITRQARAGAEASALACQRPGEQGGGVLDGNAYHIGSR